MTTTVAIAINTPIMRVKEMEGKIERERESVAVLPCFPLCRMTSGCCLSNWLGLPPIRAQAGKVPLGYTQPQKQEAGREREIGRERERECSADTGLTVLLRHFFMLSEKCSC